MRIAVAARCGNTQRCTAMPAMHSDAEVHRSAQRRTETHRGVWGCTAILKGARRSTEASGDLHRETHRGIGMVIHRGMKTHRQAYGARRCARMHAATFKCIPDRDGRMCKEMWRRAAADCAFKSVKRMSLAARPRPIPPAADFRELATSDGWGGAVLCW